MNDPIKIIYKYKNNNRRVQYQIYIFIGDIVEERCTQVLTKIKNFDLYTTLTVLSNEERAVMVENYGEYWYEKFFNGYHINATKENVLADVNKMGELRSIYGDKWINEHFVDFKKRLQTVTFRYEYMVKEERKRKMTRKAMQKQQIEMEEMVDYTTKTDREEYLSRITWGTSNDSTENSASEETSAIQVGGKKEQNVETRSIQDEEENLEIDTLEREYDNIEDGKILEFETQVDQDLEDADIIFTELDETDKNLKLTTKDIKAVISSEIYNEIYHKILEFDGSKDNNMFDENLKDVYSKNYVTHQYIYKDDTIKTIHNKITCGFKNSNKFGENTYIPPSYQYLWTEYYFEGRREKVMLGQKWIIRNDIIKIDVEPNNNLAVYEDLRGNLKLLRDHMRRQGKIRREDDENYIFYDYEGFYTYNEIFMVDIYNELGINYEPSFEELKNLMDVYLKIYFNKIRPDDIKNIIEFLNTRTPDNKKVAERNKLKAVFDTINNDLILENEIMREVELVGKYKKDEYSKIFKENYVTQSVIRTYVYNSHKKLDLYRIFDNFTLDSDYPFIQYQPNDGTPRFRYNEKYLVENEKKDIIIKWFESSPYGISFKVRVGEKPNYKYMAINLSDVGRIDYKIQWKEDDMFTVDDISRTYQYVRSLIEKINSENEKYNIILNMPKDEDFKFAFINTIQRFELPNNFLINHNDLSEFSRYFYPYVALVIEPRKRESKLKKMDNEKGKYGTYLRYKRISRYENRTKMERRIIFFMRNYEYNDQSLANEISREFNITEEQAMAEIENVRSKYPHIRKSRKILKKFENIPKYKSPGVGIDIQGKTRSRYKMRIAGARDKEQLERIIRFMNILLYLYIETYLYKKPERQKMKDYLKRLTKIAKRRNKVEEIVDYDREGIRLIKQMTSIDRRRLSYKAEEDQNQWTRNCQNSGKDKLRRPQQFLNADDLIARGYVWKDKLDEFDFGHYEKNILVDEDGKTDSKKKKREVTLRAIKLPLDDTGENFVYYTCDPKENGKHMYIGFLSKSKNPYGEPMPCCFIKDHLYSKNKDKRNFYLRSIGLLPKEETKVLGDYLYILQDSNKIQEGRLAFLPKYLDIFLNIMLGNDVKIKNHYLLSTNPGYYFKYGVRQNVQKYLSAISSVFDMRIDELKNKMVQTLEDDKNLSIFTSLNNGDIRTQFGSKEEYISLIKNNEYLEYPLVNDLISLPGVVDKDGVNIIIFRKKVKLIRHAFEKEKVEEDYYIACQNQENMDDIKNPTRKTALIIKDRKNYYPIVMVNKSDTKKDIVITKTFTYSSNPKNIINHIFKYYKISCQTDYFVLVNNKIPRNYHAKKVYQILSELKRKDFLPKVQYIDPRYKCRYFVTYDGFIIPTIPSGSIYHLKIINNLSKYAKSFDETYKYLTEIYNLTNKLLGMKPVGVFYRDRKEKNYVVIAIMTESYDSVPIVEQIITPDFLRDNKLVVQNVPNDDIIDKEILKGPNNIVIDNRIYYVSKNRYEKELYQLFRFHLSYYLNNVPMGLKYKSQLENIISNNKMTKHEKKLEIKKILYRMSSKELAKTFNILLEKRMEYGENVSKKMRDTKNPMNKYVENDLSSVPSALTQAKFPIGSVDRVSKSTQIIQEKLKSFPDNNLSELDFTEPVPPPISKEIIRPNPPKQNIHFYPQEKQWIHVMPSSKEIDYTTFILKNKRELCYGYDDKTSCSNGQYCNWVSSKNMCLLSVRQDLLIDFINQVAEEFMQNELKAHEILRRGDYYVSDIVNYNVYTERPGERIIISSSTNVEKILAEIFGKNNIPKIGRRRSKIGTIKDFDQLNIENPMKEMLGWYVQNIMENNNTIFRAFANTYYWLLHPYNSPNYRNLGYYSILQTTLSNIYKSQVVDWLLVEENREKIKNLLPTTEYDKISDYITKLSTEVRTLTNYLVELYVLSKLYDVMIYVYDENFQIVYVFHPQNGLVYNRLKKIGLENLEKYSNTGRVVNLRFHYISKNIFPDRVDALYPKE